MLQFCRKSRTTVDVNLVKSCDTIFYTLSIAAQDPLRQRGTFTQQVEEVEQEEESGSLQLKSLSLLNITT